MRYEKGIGRGGKCERFVGHSGFISLVIDYMVHGFVNIGLRKSLHVHCSNRKMLILFHEISF